MDESRSASMFHENNQYDGMTRTQKIELVEIEIEDLSRGQILENDAKDFRVFPIGSEKTSMSCKQSSDKIIFVLSEDHQVTA